MPLYEYECDACHHRFERIQKSFSEPPIEVCPKCGKGPVKKLVSSPAIQFKGSGWYITDYARKSGTDAGTKSTGGGDTSSSTPASTTSSTTTDTSSKPADKADKSEKKS
jgi:putative FmdB family regulatory protein